MNVCLIHESQWGGWEHRWRMTQAVCQSPQGEDSVSQSVGCGTPVCTCPAAPTAHGETPGPRGPAARKPPSTDVENTPAHLALVLETPTSSQQHGQRRGLRALPAPSSFLYQAGHSMPSSGGCPGPWGPAGCMTLPHPVSSVGIWSQSDPPNPCPVLGFPRRLPPSPRVCVSLCVSDLSVSLSLSPAADWSMDLRLGC